MKTDEEKKEDVVVKDESDISEADIDAGIETFINDRKSGKDEGSEKGEKGEEKPNKDAGKDLPEGDDQAGEEGSEDKGGKAPEDEGAESGEGSEDEGGKAPVLSDDHLTRAVKAGLTMAEARTFTDAKALERVCEMLEAKAGGDKKDGDGASDKDPLESIPDLDPEEYDEKLVAMVKGLKSIIRSQHDQLKGLVSSGEKNRERDEQDWFDDKISTLGDKFESVLGKGPTSKLDSTSPQAKKRAELGEKVKVLSAGYKASGKDIDRGAIFQEAVNVVLSDVVVELARAERAEALKKRAGQHSNRPTGNNSKPSGDIFADIANEINDKFYKK